MKDKVKIRKLSEEYVERSYTFTDLSASSDDDYNVIGHAAVFEQKTNIGGYFDEVIERGAFDGCDLTDVSLFVNHMQSSIPLARSRNGQGTMAIGVDDKGLFIKAKLDIENNQDAKNLHSAISRGDISGMSFAFRVKDQKWEGMDTDMPLRRILKVSKVSEVSAVTYPAYQGTDIDSRSKQDLDEAVKQFKRSSVDYLELERLRTEFLSKLI